MEGNMISNNLFQEVLVEPINSGANHLYIVSGYATAAMAFHHLDSIRRTHENVQIHLIIGMCPIDGLSLSNHRAFQKLMCEDFSDSFECNYMVNTPPVHSKVYSWYKDENPLYGFTGSANYTQTAFSEKQREVMATCDAQQAFDYFSQLASETIYCTHLDAENFIRIYNDRSYPRIRRERPSIEVPPQVSPAFGQDLQVLPSVKVSLLGRNGDLPQRSGLNWGQRPEEHREPNQAYIRLTADIYNTDFFPPVKVHFTLLTDDSKVLICTRAQQNGKAIHTPHNNSLIGEYFRNRLGVSNGAPVHKQDLVRYGRTDVTFYKIDDETYFMDFAV